MFRGKVIKKGFCSYIGHLLLQVVTKSVVSITLFHVLLYVCSEQANNLRLMREIGLTSRLLHVMWDPRLSPATIQVMASLIGVLLEGHPDTQALLKLVKIYCGDLENRNITENLCNLMSNSFNLGFSE